MVLWASQSLDLYTRCESSLKDIFMEQAMRYLFLLAVLLVVAAYFVGVSTDGATLFAGINQLGQTFTGRNAANKFAGYPQAA